MDHHLTSQEIQAFIEARLDHRERERILEHVDHCPLCVKWLADGVQEKRAMNRVIRWVLALACASRMKLTSCRSQSLKRMKRLGAGPLFWLSRIRSEAIPKAGP